MANNNVGSKRLVVGAHYGLKGWLAQRVTAILMVVYTFVLLFSFLTGQNFTYAGWAGVFAQQWFKLLSLVTILGLAYHAWLGMREIWIDYIKSLGLRLTLQMLSAFWLIACTAWAVQILWSV